MNLLVAMLAGSGDVNPIFAILFIVVIIVIALAAVKSGSNGGAKKIKQEYGDKIVEEGTFLKSMHYFFTQDEFLVQKYNAVFASYNLKDIRFVGIRWDATQRLFVLYLTDAEQKKLKPANVIGGTKAARKLYGEAMPAMKQPDAEKLRDLIIKHAPQAQFEEKAK